MNLYEKLEEYSRSDYYPFHMPGHKRTKEMNFLNPFQFDITEIDGFDNLHYCNGILLDAQRKASSLYEADESFFLINGTTGGLLSAIAACTTKGGSVLMARNCHKAVYHAVFLNDLQNSYIYPQTEEKYCVNGGLNPENLKKMLINNKNIQAVIITSPTYDGIVSDIESIAKEVHKFNIPLIVDEAHGAHFGFHPYFPDNSNKKGADIVIHSVHKTLPSLTQTALLHVNGTLVDRDKLKRYLSIYQTSSPSYVLMASIDSCVQLIKEKGAILFQEYVDELDLLRKELSKLKNIKLVDETIIGNHSIYDLDRSKIILSVKDTDITGKELYNTLLNKYHLQMEMAAGNYILAMTSIMDTKEGYKRLQEALFHIDKEINTIENKMELDMDFKIEKHLTIAQALEKEQIECKLEESFGEIAAEYIYLYPPGIPLIVPGEKITRDLIEQIKKYIIMGLNIEGMKDNTYQKIKIIK